jgi:hypothetical protein
MVYPGTAGRSVRSYAPPDSSPFRSYGREQGNDLSDNDWVLDLLSEPLCRSTGLDEVPNSGPVRHRQIVRQEPYQRV